MRRISNLDKGISKSITKTLFFEYQTFMKSIQIEKRRISKEAFAN
jgi:hypothetical protein